MSILLHRRPLSPSPLRLAGRGQLAVQFGCFGGTVLASPMRIILSGLLAGAVSNAVVGLIFTRKPVHAMIHDSSRNSRRYIDTASQMNLPVAIIGLILLSIIHSFIFAYIGASLPGATWISRGIVFGIMIWLFFWLFQEWFAFHCLLGVPFSLNFFRLCVLLIGAVIEGIIISWLVVV